MFTGKDLQAFRTRYKLTQQQVADYCRVKVREVGRWEHDTVAMPLQRQYVLARLMWSKAREKRTELCPCCLGIGRVIQRDQ